MPKYQEGSFADYVGYRADFTVLGNGGLKTHTGIITSVKYDTNLSETVFEIVTSYGTEALLTRSEIGRIYKADLGEGPKEGFWGKAAAKLSIENKELRDKLERMTAERDAYSREYKRLRPHGPCPCCHEDCVGWIVDAMPCLKREED